MQIPIVLLLALTGCGLTAAQVQSLELCCTQAEAEARKRIDTECAGAKFSECPSGTAILADLRKTQAACK